MSEAPLLPVYEFAVERTQLRLFAKAVGETRAIYLEDAAAQAAGFRAIPALPSFGFTLAMRPEAPFDMLEILGIDLSKVLHGEQAFEYERPICAGDVVRVERTLLDRYEKKGGALKFFVVEARMTDAATGELFGCARQTIVERHEVSA